MLKILPVFLIFLCAGVLARALPASPRPGTQSQDDGGVLRIFVDDDQFEADLVVLDEMARLQEEGLLLRVARKEVKCASYEGHASWYGPGFNGKKTASGQIFNENKMTAAHKKLPFGTRLRVTNLGNGQSVIVTVNDRGPFVKGRLIDLSKASARKIGITGVARVKIETCVDAG